MPETQGLTSPFVIVGEEDVVLGFKALGFKVVPFEAAAEARQVLAEVVESQAAVCLLRIIFIKPWPAR
jgi:vacuolar-type H+-ATPase subunit F/Vma7